MTNMLHFYLISQLLFKFVVVVYWECFQLNSLIKWGIFFFFFSENTVWPLCSISRSYFISCQQKFHRTFTHICFAQKCLNRKIDMKYLFNFKLQCTSQPERLSSCYVVVIFIYSRQIQYILYTYCVNRIRSDEGE